MSDGFNELITGLPDHEVTLKDEEAARAEGFGCTIEVRPDLMADTLSAFSWQVKITTTAENISFLYAVAGEPGGPFRAAQRAIDLYAFGIQFEKHVAYDSRWGDRR